MKTRLELRTESIMCCKNLSVPETVRMFTYNYLNIQGLSCQAYTNT